MKYLFMGESQVSVVGLGTWQFGEPGWGWGSELDYETAIKIVHRALELGINFFDTAEVYGSGKSEEILGEALEGSREQAFIATKVAPPLRPDRIMRSATDSLSRLKVEAIDLYQLHAPDRNVPLERTMRAIRKLLDEGRAGDNAGLLLRGVGKEDIQRGQVLAKKGSITPHTKFKGEVYVLTKDEGGRHTPFFDGYRPQLYFRTTDVTGAANLPDGVEMVMPGDNVQMEVELITPIAMDSQLRFAIREGGRTVGSGVVTEIIE